MASRMKLDKQAKQRRIKAQQVEVGSDGEYGEDLEGISQESRSEDSSQSEEDSFIASDSESSDSSLSFADKKEMKKFLSALREKKQVKRTASKRPFQSSSEEEEEGGVREDKAPSAPAKKRSIPHRQAAPTHLKGEEDFLAHSIIKQVKSAEEPPKRTPATTETAQESLSRRQLSARAAAAQRKAKEEEHERVLSTVLRNTELLKGAMQKLGEYLEAFTRTHEEEYGRLLATLPGALQSTSSSLKLMGQRNDDEFATLHATTSNGAAALKQLTAQVKGLREAVLAGVAAVTPPNDGMIHDPTEQSQPMHI